MLRAAVILLFIVLLPSHVCAEARIALLIGNQAHNTKVGPLRNPHEDVALVGAALKQLVFQVTILKDAAEVVRVCREVEAVTSLAPLVQMPVGSPGSQVRR